MPNQISKILEEIREYTQNHTELKKSHHFLFNCPLSSGPSCADVIVIGLNPGETRSDWECRTSLPTEESSEFDFHDEYGRGRSSVRWSKLCREYLPNSNIFLSEFFFWSSGTNSFISFEPPAYATWISVSSVLKTEDFCLRSFLPISLILYM